MEIVNEKIVDAIENNTGIIAENVISRDACRRLVAYTNKYCYDRFIKYFYGEKNDKGGKKNIADIMIKVLKTKPELIFDIDLKKYPEYKIKFLVAATIADQTLFTKLKENLDTNEIKEYYYELIIADKKMLQLII
jgi:hypothetical protein